MLRIYFPRNSFWGAQLLKNVTKLIDFFNVKAPVFQNEEKFRHEIKFVFDGNNLEILKSWLKLQPEAFEWILISKQRLED